MVLPKLRFRSTTLQGVGLKKTVTFILALMRTVYVMKDNQFTKYSCFKKLGILQIRQKNLLCTASGTIQTCLSGFYCPVSISYLISSLKSSWLKESCVNLKNERISIIH